MEVSFTDQHYKQFRALILTHTGLDFPPQRRADLAAWLERAIQLLQDALRYQTNKDAPPSTLEALYQRLQARDALAWEKVIDAITVGETHFFRNAPQFDALRDYILPPLLAERREAHNLQLRLWSAGCATGEEPYSIAMLLKEMLPDLAQWRLSLLASDINQGFVAQAQEGVYRDWSFREDYAVYAQATYFTQINNRFLLDDSIRRMVKFESQSLLDYCRNLSDDTRNLDLIVCRNVVLYFGDQVRRWVYQQFLEMLRPGGWLLVGHADPPPPQFAAFEIYNLRGTIAYRRPLKKPAPALSFPTDTRPRLKTVPLPEPDVTDATIEPDSTDARMTAELQYRLGRWHADRQHWQDALYHCKRAIGLNPTYTEVYYTLGLIHQNLNDTENAIEALRRAIYLRRDWPLPRFTLAGIYRDDDQVNQARRELRNVIALTNAAAPDAPIEGADGLTAARLREAAMHQLQTLPDGSDNTPE